jgi:hypothetical protein
MASVRLWFLLNLGRCAAEVLADELLTWTTGRGALGAETLLAMLTLPVPMAMLGVACGTVVDAVVTDVAIAVADDAVAAPTGYIPVLCVVSSSPVLDDIVDVPVVPELGEGCLKPETTEALLPRGSMRNLGGGIAKKRRNAPSAARFRTRNSKRKSFYERDRGTGREEIARGNACLLLSIVVMDFNSRM